MIEDIIALLNLFEAKVPDKSSNIAVLNLVQNNKQWGNAHDLFDDIRNNNLIAIKNKDVIKSAQYSFEEVCVKSIYNLYCNAYEEDDPFDADSPHWIIKNALHLAYRLGFTEMDVINIVAPNK